MGRILTSTGAERLDLALAVARLVHGLDQTAIDEPVDRLGRSDLLPPGIPGHWTVRQVIARGVEEARHGAQEVLDEIAHADGWPR